MQVKGAGCPPTRDRHGRTEPPSPSPRQPLALPLYGCAADRRRAFGDRKPTPLPPRPLTQVRGPRTRWLLL